MARLGASLAGNFSARIELLTATWEAPRRGVVPPLASADADNATVHANASAAKPRPDLRIRFPPSTTTGADNNAG